MPIRSTLRPNRMLRTGRDDLSSPMRAVRFSPTGGLEIRDVNPSRSSRHPGSDQTAQGDAVMHHCGPQDARCTDIE